MKGIALVVLGIVALGCSTSDSPPDIATRTIDPTAEFGGVGLPAFVVVDHGSPSDVLDFGGVLVRPGATNSISTADVETFIKTVTDAGGLTRGTTEPARIVGQVDMWTGLVSDMNVRRVDDFVSPQPPKPTPGGSEVPLPRDLPAVLLVFRMVAPVAPVGPPHDEPTTTHPSFDQALMDVIVALDATTGEMLFIRSGPAES